jgi:group II intron reverse transcriptase/maturase
MQPTTKILERITQNSRKNKDEIFTRLFRYLLRPDLYFEAYKKLYANNGAGTHGVNQDTADGFSEQKVMDIIKMLENGTFQPAPVRRTNINKKNKPGKKRLLGIPTFTDKLVQEVLRMILKSVYEPVFLNCSYGFRPGKSCHAALKDLKHQFHGTRWFIEGDIKACFDNIDHDMLIKFINNKVKDARLTQIVHKFLKAGYLENWQYHKTHSGTPQGGIISPLLANIYLHELDKFVMKLKNEFDKPKERNFTDEYSALQSRMTVLRRQIKKAEGERRQDLIKQHKLAKQELLKTPCKSQTDKVIKYIRYADDFIIGVNGSFDDCVEVKRKLTEFIGKELKMELSKEKTLITHSNEKARFLGYDVRVRRDNRTLKHGGPTQTLRRNLSNMTELTVPFEDTIHKFIFSKKIAEQKKDGKLGSGPN